MWKNIKKYSSILISIVIVILLTIPFILAYLYLKQKGKRLQIYPEFKVVDSKTEDLTDLQTAIDEAKEILNRFNK